MKVRVERSAVIITPTIAAKVLTDCVESVKKQTYKNLKHLLVIDGPAAAQVYWNSPISKEPGDNLETLTLPYNTGADGWYGHRIYSALPFLVNHDYVLFLDEDNWIEPDHVEKLIGIIEQENWDWAYSLRNIYDKEGKFVAIDNCESLGSWPIWWSADKPVGQQEFLIDTSSYCFKREWLVQYCHNWNSGWGGDRRFYHIISKIIGHTNYGTSGKHTLNYRLDDNIDKKYGNINFFADGNKVMEKIYGEKIIAGGLPWQK